MTERTRLRDDSGAATGLPLVAAAAALWGTDALFRRGLALELPAATVVLYEHLILTLLTLPVLARIPWGRLGRSDLASLVVIGGGASALATGLFTASFRYGDPTTVLLLQKLQPFVAVVGARLLLGERLSPRFAGYFLAAGASAWLITFPDPLSVTARSATAGALAAAAAALWGLGTVLGRRMTATLSVTQLTAARFGFGLPAAAIFVVVGGAGAVSLRVQAGDLVPLLLLSLVPGLLALLLYYRGLGRTPASVATLAELAFPLSAIVVNYLAFGTVTTGTQLVGTVMLSSALVAMAAVGRRPRGNLGVHIPRRPAPAEATTR